MSAMSDGCRVEWLPTGREGLAAMLAAIEGARSSIALEMYIFEDGPVGSRFRDALTAAALRGVRLRALIDAFGSLELSSDYFAPVNDAGGDCRWFNPEKLRRFTYRDHRKLLVVDDEVAFVMGFNIGTHYDGDGVVSGWRDEGVVVGGDFVEPLVQAFHGMFGSASFRHKRLSRFRRHLQPQRIPTRDGDVFLLSPGRGRNPAREALTNDLRTARNVRFTTAYFLPPARMRRAMAAAARNGTDIQLILPGRSDVKLSQLAARGLYAPLLRAGVQIFEYQPAVLHTKKYIIDDIVYVGSANLDLRSLNINYELLLRIHDPRLAAEGLAQFDVDLAHSRRITWAEWRQRSWWNRMTERMAGFFLVRIDARFAMRQLHRLNKGMIQRRKSGQR